MVSTNINSYLIVCITCQQYRRSWQEHERLSAWAILCSTRQNVPRVSASRFSGCLLLKCHAIHFPWPCTSLAQQTYNYGAACSHSYYVGPLAGCNITNSAYSRNAARNLQTLKKVQVRHTTVFVGVILRSIAAVLVCERACVCICGICDHYGQLTSGCQRLLHCSRRTRPGIG